MIFHFYFSSLNSKRNTFIIHSKIFLLICYLHDTLSTLKTSRRWAPSGTVLSGLQPLLMSRVQKAFDIIYSYSYMLLTGQITNFIYFTTVPTKINSSTLPQTVILQTHTLHKIYGKEKFSVRTIN